MKMLRDLIKFCFCPFLLFCIDFCAENDATEQSPNVASIVTNIPQDDSQLKKFVIQRVKIPLVFEDYVNMLIFDVEIFVTTETEINILNSHAFELLDLIICDTFDSARFLLEEKRTFTKSMGEKLRKRIWILLAKKLYTVNKYFKIKNVTLTKITYMSRQK